MENVADRRRVWWLFARDLPFRPIAANLPNLVMCAKKLKIDFGELLPALEGFGGPELMHHLDAETGEIIALHDDFPEAQEIRERLDEGSSERYEVIEALDSHESFRIMEGFVATLPESPRRAQLLEALSRNKPFRRFKDIVQSDITLRDPWFAFHDDALAAYAHDWLEVRGIEAISARPGQ